MYQYPIDNKTFEFAHFIFIEKLDFWQILWH
jgi:hypothetical protein